MTVETEVSKGVIEMKSGQDLVTSDCNVSDCDPDNSYVFVSERDGLGDDHVETKERDLVSGLVIKNQAVVDGKNKELDVSEIENVAVNDDNIDKVEIANEEVESSVVTETEAATDQNGNLENVEEDLNEEIESAIGGGITESGDHQDGILEYKVKSDGEQDKDEIRNLERLEGSELEVVADPSGNLENVTGNESKEVEHITERINSSTSEEIREGDQENGNSQDELTSDFEQAQSAIESLDGSESDVVAVPNENVQNVDENEDPSETLKSLGETEIETVSNQPEKLECGIMELGDPNERLETLGGAESETAGKQHEKIECGAETEIKEVEDVNEIYESSAGAETEKVVDQKNEVEAGSIIVVENDGESETEMVADHKNGGSAEAETVTDKTYESVVETEKVAAESDNVADQKNEGESETEMVADHKNDGLDEAVTVMGKTYESAVETEKDAAESYNVADQKNGGESETEMVADHKNNGSAEAETATDETNESAVETEKVAAESDNVVDQKNDGEFEIETVADHKNDGVVETETVKDETNESVLETEKTTDKTNECVSETKLQKFEDQIEPESSDAPIDNQESHVQDRELFNESGNENGESGICKKSQSVIEDPIESEFQEVSSKGLNEIKLAETVNDEIPPPTTMVTDIEAHPVDSNVETLEEQANVALVSDAMENQKYETAPFIQGEPQQAGEVETIVIGDDKQLETVCEVPEETIANNISVSHVEDIAQNDDEHEKPSDVIIVSSKLTQTENEIEASVLAQSLTASYADKPRCYIDVPGAETASFSPVDSPKSQIVESGPSNHESNISDTSTPIDANSESNSVPGMTVSAETEQTLVYGDVHVESDVSNVKPEILSNQPYSVDVKLESGSNLVLGTAGIEETENQVDSPKPTTDENVSIQENKDIENSQSDCVSGASLEDSSTGAIIEKETSIAAETKPFNYIMRVPRFNDESLKERIIQAKVQVEEKTKLRDAIQSQVQHIRANGQIHGVDYEYAKGEIRNARKLVRAKRVEIDSLHSVINKAKNAISIDDIDTRIYSMEHMMQHETLPLKEEKQFIREIKQLKSLRDELSSNMGSDDEIKQALEQKDEAEERLKILRKELEKLKGNVQKAESAAMEAERKYEDENKKVKELQAQFRAANDVRQEAYAQWLSLRKELSEKNKYFFKYKDDTAAANNYAFRRDRESLYRLCTDQVEQLMELWNTNEDFRKEYVSFNVRSTVRRFGTLDGRALSPDEEPPILPSYVDERVHRFVSTPTNADLVSKSVVELKSEETVEKGTVNDKSVKEITENENQKVKSKKSTEYVLANGLPTAASLQAPDEVMSEPEKSREEIELDRKAEEMRKKEDEAKLKEQRRLEGLAKANEARERKKRQAEKIQMRAELKARKEAEEKEKEREKRLRKKEKKKATDSNDGNNNSDSAPSSESAIEIGKEIDAKDMASVVAKKPQKIVKSNKKVSSIPAHIRNRNKRKWQNYAYVTMAGILVLILFWVGNVSLFTDRTFKKPNPFH